MFRVNSRTPEDVENMQVRIVIFGSKYLTELSHNKYTDNFQIKMSDMTWTPGGTEEQSAHIYLFIQLH